MSSSALLISNDAVLRQSIAGTMVPDSSAPLQFATRTSDTRSSLDKFQSAIVFFHIADPQDSSCAVALLQSDVADYLVRPRNLTRIVMLADVLSLRTRPQSNAAETFECRAEVLAAAARYKSAVYNGVFQLRNMHLNH